MNNVSLIGNLTKDPELRYTATQERNAVCRFTLAVNEGYGDKQRTSFIPVVAFGKTAENCNRYLSKGKKAGVSGRIQTGSYEKDGRKVYTIDVIATSVEFLSGNEAAHNEAAYTNDGFTPLRDDDIPF